MASRLLRTNLIRHHRRVSAVNPVLPSTVTASTAAVPEILTFDQPKPDDPIPPNNPVPTSLDLSDDARLFASVPTSELLRSTAVLHTAAIGPMVDFGSWVMNSRLMDVGLTRNLVLWIVRRTFYDHFCAGKDAAEAAARVRSVYETSRLKGMLVYGVEHAEDGGACDNNLLRILETVDPVRLLPSSCVSSAVVKITAICPVSLLKRVSDLLRWQYKNPNFNLPWKFQSFPIFSDSSPIYHTVSEPEPLTQEEEQELEKAHERLRIICRRCQESGVPLLIDAEDTILQPAIDYMAYSSAGLFKSENRRPVVYNTIQAYRRDAGERLALAVREAERLGVQIGFKLVRGAYMSSERRLASSLGCKSPIHDSVQATHACYNNCLSFLLEKVANGSNIGVVLATHNVDSGKLAVKKSGELGIEKGNESVEFAQLHGMSEAFSLALRNAGFSVSKYMPYGPVEIAIPYLIRRAEENRGMLANSALDPLLMRKELQRRIKAAIM